MYQTFAGPPEALREGKKFPSFFMSERGAENEMIDKK